MQDNHSQQFIAGVRPQPAELDFEFLSQDDMSGNNNHATYTGACGLTYNGACLPLMAETVPSVLLENACEMWMTQPRLTVCSCRGREWDAAPANVRQWHRRVLQDDIHGVADVVVLLRSDALHEHVQRASPR